MNLQRPVTQAFHPQVPGLRVQVFQVEPACRICVGRSGWPRTVLAGSSLHRTLDVPCPRRAACRAGCPPGEPRAAEIGSGNKTKIPALEGERAWVLGAGTGGPTFLPKGVVHLDRRQVSWLPVVRIPTPSRPAGSVGMSVTRRPMDRQPVTVAGPRQICTAFPILPLPGGRGHLQPYDIPPGSRRRQAKMAGES